VIAARKIDQLTATAEEIRKSGGKCDTMQINIRDSVKAVELIEAIVAKHGKLTCLVVCPFYSCWHEPLSVLYN